MTCVANYPFQFPCLVHCDAAQFNDRFDGVDIDHPAEQTEIELQKAMTKLDTLRMAVFNEQIRFKELVNTYYTTLGGMTAIKRSYWAAAKIFEKSRQISKCHLDFMKRKFDIMDKHGAMSLNLAQEKIYKDKLNDVDKALKFFENVTIFRERVAKKFDLPNSGSYLTPCATFFLPAVTLLASYLPIKV